MTAALARMKKVRFKDGVISADGGGDDFRYGVEAILAVGQDHHAVVCFA